MNTDCRQVEEDLAAYALGALEMQESAAVAAHLEGCTACTRILRDYEETVTALARHAPALSPPGWVRERVIDSATHNLPGAPPRHSDEGGISRRGGIEMSFWKSRRFLALAVAATVLLASAAVLAVLLNRTAQDRDAAVETSQILAAYIGAGGIALPLTRQEVASSASYAGEGSLYLAEGMAPLLVLSNCPPSDDYYNYRVWMADAGDRTGVGEIIVDENGVGTLVLSDSSLLGMYDQIGVSLVWDDAERVDLLIGSLPDARVASSK